MKKYTVPYLEIKYLNDGILNVSSDLDNIGNLSDWEENENNL